MPRPDPDRAVDIFDTYVAAIRETNVDPITDTLVDDRGDADPTRLGEWLQARSNIAQEVRDRAERLKKIVRYRNTSDTVPTPESIMNSEGDALATPAVGATAAKLPNVLAEDTWDLFRVLLR